MDRKDSDLEEKDDFLFEIKKLVMPKGAENRFFVTLWFFEKRIVDKLHRSALFV